NYIGMLERVFIFVFIITGNWEGIGFLLAAKSIFRFGDLKDSKDRNLTEYILIGTLLSFGIVDATALLVIHLVEVKSKKLNQIISYFKKKQLKKQKRIAT